MLCHANALHVDDTANGFATVHHIESGVDIIQAEAMGDELIHFEGAVHVLHGLGVSKMHEMWMAQGEGTFCT